MSFPLTGTCNCGAVQFEVTEPFIGSNYCHCTRCQRRTGAGASPNARVADGSFRIVRGEDQILIPHELRYCCRHLRRDSWRGLLEGFGIC